VRTARFTLRCGLPAIPFLGFTPVESLGECSGTSASVASSNSRGLSISSSSRTRSYDDTAFPRAKSSSYRSRLLTSLPCRSIRPCSTATSPITLERAGRPGEPANTILTPIMAGYSRGFTFFRKNCGKYWRESPGYAEPAGGGISPNISSWHMSNVRWHIKSDSGLWLALEKSLNDACMNHKVYVREKHHSGVRTIGLHTSMAT